MKNEVVHTSRQGRYSCPSTKSASGLELPGSDRVKPFLHLDALKRRINLPVHPPKGTAIPSAHTPIARSRFSPQEEGILFEGKAGDRGESCPPWGEPFAGDAIMQALYYRTFGDIGVLRLGEVPTPNPLRRRTFDPGERSFAQCV